MHAGPRALHPSRQPRRKGHPSAHDALSSPLLLPEPALLRRLLLLLLLQISTRKREQQEARQAEEARRQQREKARDVSELSNKAPQKVSSNKREVNGGGWAYLKGCAQASMRCGQTSRGCERAVHFF